ncbi:hypothetical protein JVT61DRAFT_13986 [Boletus reticuloceps]|uniref:Uncharacterized protein n=1 Tax=Boletus reticuloceps TaxID=495285 RepID=A0A8I2YSG0_9AGAM|nr:hypothetical protein JVT61DRAFT_13986 [Boletus reticuloceps]
MLQVQESDQGAAQPFNLPEETLSKDLEGTEIPTTIPPAIKAQLFPLEKLSLSAFINFDIPPRASTGSEANQYFCTLAPDTLTTPAVSDALRSLPLPPHQDIRQLSLQAAHAWKNGS